MIYTFRFVPGFSMKSPYPGMAVYGTDRAQVRICRIYHGNFIENPTGYNKRWKNRKNDFLAGQVGNFLENPGVFFYCVKIDDRLKNSIYVNLRMLTRRFHRVKI